MIHPTPDSLLVIAIELGFKQLVGDGRIEWTAAIFQLEQRDISAKDPHDPTRIRFTASNAGAASSWRSHGVRSHCSLTYGFALR